MMSAKTSSLDTIATLRATVDELQARNAELMEALAARETFIAVAAHELRNPMTPMIGQIDLLLAGVKNRKYSPEQIEQRLERIALVMNHYVKRAAILLNVSRITSGKLKLEPAACDLAGLIREIVEAFSDAAHHAGSSINIDVPTSLPGSWDRLAVEQIIDNLVSNAIKYGARGAIEVCAGSVDDKVLVEVRDHGPGIPLEDRERVFGRFERAVGQEETRSGFGIGLWVVNQLVEAMEGKITINEAQGGGALFGVTLPRNTPRDRP